MSTLDNVHIIMVGITHPGNIGAAARAMKTMSLSHLTLVQPRYFPADEATFRATGADDILTQATVCDTLPEALQDCRLIIGTSARERSIPWMMLTPKMCADKVLQAQGKVAIVFGREHSGLTNAEVDLCHYLVKIPTNPQFSSLNVASAVQVIAYELQCAENACLAINPFQAVPDSPPASADAMAQFYQHLEKALVDIDFLDAQKPRRLLRRLQRLFNRAQLEEAEVNLLRGILSAIQSSKVDRN